MHNHKTHDIVLEGIGPGNTQIRLRPMMELDWDLLFKWNNDPEVLYYAEEDDISAYTLEGIKHLYRSVCEKATCFIIECDSKPIGECWLQEMNIDRVLEAFPELDILRIDLTIGEKSYWNKGIGTTVIQMLTEFGFQHEGADLIYEPGIADYNLRSIKAFQKAGFEIVSTTKQDPGRKAKILYDLVLTRDRFESDS
jgi:aminoglycoside 6'-N-acetyltransferase